MASRIGRRKFLATLGGAAACPLAARAQQPAVPVIGFMHILSPENVPHFVPAFRVSRSRASSKARTWRSNIGGRTDNTIDCRSWQPI